MITLKTVRSSVLALVGLVALMPSGVRADLASDSVAVGNSLDVLNGLQAEAMAVASIGTPEAVEKAVMLHGQVANRRTVDDPLRLGCLLDHARLLDHYGRPDAALLYMEAAADQAVVEGRDYEAANALIDAAILAAELDQPEAARRFIVRADGILHNSLQLDPVEQVAVRSRLHQ